MRAPRLAPAVLCLLAAGALLSGCGGGSGEGTAGEAETARSRPAPPKAEFPSPEGRTLREVLKAADGPAEWAISPGAMVFYPGSNRYPFEVSERDGTPISDAEVALYYAKVPRPKDGAESKSGVRGQNAKAEEQALDQPAVGPFPASIESLATKPAFRAKTTSDDPDAAQVVYSTQLNFPSDGEWRLAALLKEGGELKGALLSSVVVGEFKRPRNQGKKRRLSIRRPRRTWAGTCRRSRLASPRTARTRWITRTLWAKNR